MFCYFSSNLVFISLIKIKEFTVSVILECIFSHSRSMPPDPPRTLAPAARAKHTFDILFSSPNRKNAARSLLINVDKSCPFTFDRREIRSHESITKGEIFVTSQVQFAFAIWGLPNIQGSKLQVKLTQMVLSPYLLLLCRHEGFTGKYTTRKIYTKLHPGLE